MMYKNPEDLISQIREMINVRILKYSINNDNIIDISLKVLLDNR